MDATGYLAADGFLDDLLAELGEGVEVHDRLVFAPGPPRPAAWAQNIWYEPRRIEFSSISDAAAQLKAIQRNWAVYSWTLHRRAKLIQEKLPHVSAKPLVFPCDPPKGALGSWTLLDEHTLVAAPRCSSPFVNGEPVFVEDRAGPPNRAYLKLWEALTLMPTRPGPGDFCLDLGSSPGGWTWALAGLGAKVVSVDKAALDPAIAALPNVEVRRESAFGLDPAAFGPVDWLCCDVICYPERLLGMVRRWLAAGTVRNFVCTLKFQGPTDHATAREFAAIPGSRLLHLAQNKHELTWLRPAP